LALKGGVRDQSPVMERRQVYGINTGRAATYRETKGVEVSGIEQQRGTSSVRKFVIKLFDRDEGEDQGCPFGAKKIYKQMESPDEIEETHAALTR
jgi:hypothetical protein